jgi:predicted RNA binding protein YcfA (HicA-like mRNA interferase family)
VPSSRVGSPHALSALKAFLAGSGHVTVRRGDRKSQLPMHGSRKELGKGLVSKILKDLGLK